MGLKERIMKDLTSAMKEGDKTRTAALRGVKAALMEKEIALRGSGKGITEGDELSVLTGLAKKRKESIDLFLKGNRPELAALEEEELTVIREYLPRMMSEEEIAETVKRLMKETNSSTMGDFAKLMPAVMKEVSGRADGRMVQAVVRASLEGKAS